MVVRYFRSLYWIVCTLNGAGLGDILPTSTSLGETAFAIGFIASGSILCAPPPPA